VTEQQREGQQHIKEVLEVLVICFETAELNFAESFDEEIEGVGVEELGVLAEVAKHVLLLEFFGLEIMQLVEGVFATCDQIGDKFREEAGVMFLQL